MSKFKVGDKVRTTKKVGVWPAEVGDVIQVLDNWASNGKPMYVVQFEHHNDTYSVEELELIEDAPEVKVGGVIEFDQIQKGDRVRCVREFLDGFVITMEGTAERLVPQGSGKQSWMMGHNHTVATTSKGVAIQQHHILVDREEPKEWVVMVRRGEDLYDTAVGADRPMTKTEAEAFVERHRLMKGHNCTFVAVKIPEELK
jgi:hypothetical protein